MSKKDNREEAYPGEYPGETPAGEQPGSEAENAEAPAGERPNPGGQSGGDPPGGGNNTDPAAADGSARVAVEELAERLHTPASAFAAVMQIKNWAAGKKVTEAEFQTAVDGFLTAPIGGVKEPPEHKEQA
jgi:hypothetical protein